MLREAMQTQYQKVKAFYAKYESLFMPALIIWGFIYHYITFKVIPIDDVLYLVFGYLGLATITIVFMHIYDMGKISEWFRYVRLFCPLVLQFALGSVIGGVFIFYWFSGSIFASWPFIVFVIILIIALEIYKHYLENPIVQFGLYNFASYLLLAVALPYFLTSIDIGLFIAAGWISFLIVAILVFALQKSPSIISRKYRILMVCFLILVAMNIFYFYNFIPPVPLSIRDEGIYHNISRYGNNYIVTAEAKTFWQKFSFIPTIHLTTDQVAYIYTSIYSPTNLDTDIVQDWQYYDASQTRWISKSKVSYHLVGGRQEGYRGYSYKSNMQSGKWRVYTETPRGQILGRYQFNVEIVTEMPPLVQENK
ncbi:MAG TPA: DUF2914 domain-containing protein [Methylomirabilota bacterium]|nr:DUF2914 domain-containing protein [Methylomirabilota bacterium]